MWGGAGGKAEGWALISFENDQEEWVENKDWFQDPGKHQEEKTRNDAEPMKVIEEEAGELKWFL